MHIKHLYIFFEYRLWAATATPRSFQRQVSYCHGRRTTTTGTSMVYTSHVVARNFWATLSSIPSKWRWERTTYLDAKDADKKPTAPQKFGWVKFFMWDLVDDCVCVCFSCQEWRPTNFYVIKRRFCVRELNIFRYETYNRFVRGLLKFWRAWPLCWVFESFCVEVGA